MTEFDSHDTAVRGTLTQPSDAAETAENGGIGSTTVLEDSAAGLERPELIPMHKEAKTRWKTAGIWGIVCVVSGAISFLGASMVSSSVSVAFGFLAVVAFVSTIGSCVCAVAHEMQTVKFEDGGIETQHIALRKARIGSKLHLLATHDEHHVYPLLETKEKHFDAILVRRRSDNRPVGWIVDGKGYDVVTRPGYLLRRINGMFWQFSTFLFYMVSGLIFIFCLLVGR